MLTSTLQSNPSVLGDDCTSDTLVRYVGQDDDDDDDGEGS